MWSKHWITLNRLLQWFKLQVQCINVQLLKFTNVVILIAVPSWCASGNTDNGIWYTYLFDVNVLSSSICAPCYAMQLCVKECWFSIVDICNASFFWFASWWCYVWCLTRLETRTKESNRHASYTITFNCWINVYACKCEIATNLCLTWVWVRVWLLRPERWWTMLEQGKVKGNSDGGP